jgi:hypothetical protein
MHQVGDAEHALGRHLEVVEKARVGVRGRRLGNRLVVVDVEGEPDGDPALPGIEERARNELGRLLLQVEVVESEVERLLRAREEAGRELGDLERGLASVRQGADFEVRRSRGP